MELINFFKDNIFPIISILIGITGIYIGFRRDRFNSKPKALGWGFRTIAIIKKPNFDKLKITYKNRKINSLYMSRFLLINEGRLMIDHSDIPENHKIFLRKKDDSITIFESEILYCSRESSEVEITDYEDGVEIDFRYLNSGDGVILNIIHDEGSQGEIQFDIEGEVKGVSEISLVQPVKQFMIPRILLSILIIIGGGLSLLIFLAENFFNKLEMEDDLWKSLIALFTLLVPFVISVFINAKINNWLDKYLIKVAGSEKSKLLKMLNS